MTKATVTCRWSWLWSSLWLVATVWAQAPAAPAVVDADPCSAASLRATLEFLASDERAGRDSPSHGLDEARDYLIGRAQAAGLAPGVGEGYRHRYRLAGERVDGRNVVCNVRGASGESLELQPGRDVRVWRAGAGCDESDVEVARVDFAQPGVDRMLSGNRGRRPVMVEVEEASPLWKECAGPREQVGRRGRGGAPWLLVRRGALPEGELRATVSVPAPEAVDVELDNVVATWRSEGATEWVLFTAHYDHVGIGMPQAGDPIYNGADDDATGSAAVLAVAETFAREKAKLPRNLAFVWFSAEEKGLRGSRAFVEDSPIPLGDVAGVVNLEMLGRPPKEGPRKAWITGDDLSDFAEIARGAFAREDVELIRFPMAGALFYQSDNLPFAQKGVVAHAISAGSLHADYHRPSDEVSRLDVEHMSAVVHAIVGFGRELATREGRPAYNDKGRQVLRLR